MTGSAVPPDFRFPWNRTVSLADVEDRKRAARKAADERNKAARADLRRRADEAAGFSRSGKIGYAGREK